MLYADPYDDFDVAFSYENIYCSYRKCANGVRWKASTQKNIILRPLYSFQAYQALMDGRFRRDAFFEFDIYERGKKRHIRSNTIRERGVQKCLCDNALVPLITHSFVYDNSASLKCKGYSFAIRRLTAHLQQYYRHYGSDGYVLIFDFSKFFDNVSHEVIYKVIDRAMHDSRLRALTKHFVDAFGDVGLGLGSQISQVLALASANRLDHYIKETCRIKYYARYMDDGYLVHPSKKYLAECLDNIRRLCLELGIVLNHNKTRIVKLSHGFTFLKARWYLTATGKVVRKIYKRSVTKMRRKLKTFASLVQTGDMTIDDVRNSFQSWRAYALNFHAYFTILNLSRLFHELFKEEMTA